MSNVGPVELQMRGIAALKQAISLDQQNLQSQALFQYRKGLGLLLSCMKRTNDPAKQAHLRSMITKYMTRAEQLKAQTSTGSSKSATKSSSATKSKPSSKFTKGIDAKAIEHIENEILSDGVDITFDDVIGLADVKEALYEMVVLPAMRPDIFTGIRQPPKGLLLYGPPGNGKTFIAKALANQAKATFFNISASSLMSRYLGEGEKLMRALFAVARERAPSIIFIDEIDSMLSARGDGEHEAARRLKTEFLVQLDGVASKAAQDAHVVVIGATNLPEALDDAVLRRMPKRLYVPCPPRESRKHLFEHMLKGVHHNLSGKQLNKIVSSTEGWSSSDLSALVKDAALGPVRSLTPKQLAKMSNKDVGPITYDHFKQSMTRLTPSLTPAALKRYEEYHRQTTPSLPKLNGSNESNSQVESKSQWFNFS
eukprot:TRINITY_DN57487_c0_g2_i1.p1 TRINITY_DN57487_c0_g2~~TRINITY_DN57487_c0_g2_i1.p1  ORF type:complete len:425 (-),score=194.28 TRINITY_DN57487_c0_g2_i1:122-1396(-)